MALTSLTEPSLCTGKSYYHIPEYGSFLGSFIAFKAFICQGFIELIFPLWLNLSFFIAEPQVAKLQFISRPYTF
jgi:hypothetical protein